MYYEVIGELGGRRKQKAYGLLNTRRGRRAELKSQGRNYIYREAERFSARGNAANEEN